jgi:hypothetical protein
MDTTQTPHLAAIEEQDQNLHGSEELGVMSHFQARNHWTGLEELSRAYTPLELRPRWSGRTRYSTSNGGPFSNRPAHLVPTTHEVIYGNILGVWTPLPRQEHVTGTRPGACPSFQTRNAIRSRSQPALVPHLTVFPLQLALQPSSLEMISHKVVLRTFRDDAIYICSDVNQYTHSTSLRRFWTSQDHTSQSEHKRPDTKHMSSLVLLTTAVPTTSNSIHKPPS